MESLTGWSARRGSSAENSLEAAPMKGGGAAGRLPPGSSEFLNYAPSCVTGQADFHLLFYFG